MKTRSPNNLAGTTFTLSAKVYKTHIYPHKDHRLSFWALLGCVLIYISIFYLFNLPPCVFNTSKFWFLISNTLIIITAVDSGVFTSSKNKEDPPVATLIPRTSEITSKCCDDTVQEKIIVCDVEKDKRIIKNPSQAMNNNDGKKYLKAKDQTKVFQKLKHSKSESIIQFASDDHEDLNKNALHRSSMKEDFSGKIKVEENDDQFSGMSNEELNMRVEEFIRRFYNQQLRAQGRMKSCPI